MRGKRPAPDAGMEFSLSAPPAPAGAVNGRKRGAKPSGTAVPAQLVFLSSTALDLQPYRDALAKRLAASRFFKCFRHEDRGPADMTAVAFCRNAVQSSDIYVGLIGLRRGFEPDGCRSITEMEFTWAGEYGVPRMVWLAPDDFTGSSPAEAHAPRQRQRAFRERIRLNLVVSGAGFDSPAQLALEVENHLLAHMIARYHAGAEAGQVSPFIETQLTSAIGQAAANQNFDLNELAGDPEVFEPLGLLDKIRRQACVLELKLRAKPRDDLQGELASCFRKMAALASVAAPASALSLYEKAVNYDPGDIPARLGYGDWLRRIGRPDDAQEQYLIAGKKARKTRQASLEAEAYYCYALLKKAQGQYRLARRAFEQLIPFYKTSKGSLKLAGIYAVLAEIVQDEGRLGEAEQLLKAAEGLYQSLGRKDVLAEVNNSFALLYERQGDRARQKIHLLRALELALSGPFVHQLAIAYQGLAEYALSSGHHKDAGYYIGQAYTVAEAHELKIEIADILRVKANLAHAQGRLQDAIRFLESAIGLQRSLKKLHDAIATEADLASVYIDLKQFDMAEGQLRRALEGAEGLEIEEPRMRILAYLGDLEAGRGNDKQKLAYYEESLALARQLKDQYFIGELENRLPDSLKRHPAKVFNIVELPQDIAYSLNILKVFGLCLKLAKTSKGLMRLVKGLLRRANP